MTKARISERIRTKKKNNEDMSPSPKRKRRKVADPAKQGRSQGVALFSDDEDEGLAPLDARQSQNIWLELVDHLREFMEMDTHLQPGELSVQSKAKLNWTRLKKSIENCVFLMKSRRLNISKSFLKEHNMGKLLTECRPNAPDKPLVDDLLNRLKNEMARVVQRRAIANVPHRPPVQQKEIDEAKTDFKHAFNRIDEPPPARDIEKLAEKMVKACRDFKNNDFETNKNIALDRLQELDKDMRHSLVMESMLGQFGDSYNFQNLIQMTETQLKSTLRNQVAAVVQEKTIEEERTPVVGGNPVPQIKDDYKAFEPPKLAKPEILGPTFDAPEPPNMGDKKKRPRTHKDVIKQKERSQRKAEEAAKQKRMAEAKMHQRKLAKKREKNKDKERQRRHAEQSKAHKAPAKQDMVEKDKGALESLWDSAKKGMEGAANMVGIQSPSAAARRVALESAKNLSSGGRNSRSRSPSL